MSFAPHRESDWDERNDEAKLPPPMSSVVYKSTAAERPGNVSMQSLKEIQQK